MASFVYYQFKADLLAKLVSCTTGGDSFKVALYTAQPPVTQTAYNTTGEVAGTGGYTLGGVALTSPAVTSPSGGTYAWQAAPATWTSSGTGFSASYCAIYDTTNSNHLCVSFDFGGSQTASGGGTFTITFNNTNPGTIISLA